MQKPNSVTEQACLSSTVLTVHNILLLAGVISRIALQSLCHRYSDRNVSISTLKSPSFRALILLYCCIDTCIRTKSNTNECGKFIIHNFVTFSYVMPLVYEYSDRSPTRAFNQATATQSSRCPASVILRDCKTERTYKYNRTVTAQQYRYSSIVQFSSISTVYSSTIHPRANSPTLTSDST